jgi:hypothetical protein
MSYELRFPCCLDDRRFVDSLTSKNIALITTLMDNAIVK